MKTIRYCLCCSQQLSLQFIKFAASKHRTGADITLYSPEESSPPDPHENLLILTSPHDRN